MNLRAECGFLSLLGLFLPALPLQAQVSPEAAQVFNKTLEVYKSAASFSCEGGFYSQDDATPPMKEWRTVKMLFSRPDRFRLDWTEVKGGGEVQTNSIFTRDKTLFFYWANFDQYAKQTSIEDSIGTNAGISRGLSYAIPSLLLGQPGYFQFSALKKEADSELEGKKYFHLIGSTTDSRNYEFLIDQSNFTIAQMKDKMLIRSSSVEDIRKELEKTNPEIAKQMPHLPPSPDRTVETVVTFKNIQLNGEFKDAEFVFDPPKSAKLVEHIPEGLPQQ